MLSILGTYEDGNLKLDKNFSSKNPVKVIVTFLEEVTINSEKGLTLNDFSFLKSQKNLEAFSGSFSDSVIEERNSEL